MCAAAIPSVAAAVLGFLLVEARTTVARLELALNDRSQPAVKVVANGIADSAVAAERPLAPSAPERTEKDAPIAHRERLPSPFSEQSATPAALTNPDRPRYLELRNRVLRFGVEALADGSPRTTLSAPPEASPSPATSRELRELYLQNPDRQPAG
jgi:hypothetical protein